MECLKDERTALQSRIAHQRQIARGPETLGARLDSAVAALARAQQRNNDCQRALQLAQTATEASSEEASRISAEVEELKAECTAEDQDMSRGRSSTSPTDALKETSEQLKQLLTMLSQNAVLPKEHVDQAKAYTEQLMQGFETCFAAVASAEQSPAVRRRLSEKAPPPTAPSTAGATMALSEYKPTRRVGKQPMITRPRNVFDPYSRGGSARRELSV